MPDMELPTDKKTLGAATVSGGMVAAAMIVLMQFDLIGPGATTDRVNLEARLTSSEVQMVQLNTNMRNLSEEVRALRDEIRKLEGRK